MNHGFDSLLVEAWRAHKLLLIWGDTPFPPQEALRQPAALLVNQWQSVAAHCASIPWSQEVLPPLSVLSLDPTARLEVTTPNTVVVVTRNDVVVTGRPNVLKLAGDLNSRVGLFLTWDDVSAARSDQDKAHILREAVSIASGGIVLVLSPNPTPTFNRLWEMLLASDLRQAARILVLGPSDYPWPAPLVCIGSDDDAIAILSHLRQAKSFASHIGMQSEEARFDYTDLHIRISGFVNEEQAYPVEAHLTSGAYFTGGKLRLADINFWKPITDIVGYGANLFDVLFAGPLCDAYVQAKALAEAYTDERVRIRLWIAPDAAELHAIPWESMHYPTKTRRLSLTTAAKLPFSRYVRLTQAEPAPVSPRPLQMLVAIANPIDLESYTMTPLDVETEIINVLDALESVPGDQLQLTILPGHTEVSEATRARVLEAGHRLHEGTTTPTTLLQLLTHNPIHMLHIVGHGRFSRKQETAALCLEDEYGYVRWVNADVLTSYLAQVDILPHLIFLSACESAVSTGGSQTPFVSLASRLVEIGVPAVVAMQDAIPIVPARQLARAFYGYLLSHGVVDRALNQARLLLYDTQHMDWITPVLFMRLKEGKLFMV